MYGVKTGVFRMSCIYGTHQFSFEEQGWITWFVIANILNKEVTVFGDGNQVRDVLWVEDVVRAYMNYLESDIEHGVWQLGGGPQWKFTLSLNEALSLIEAKTGKTTKVKYADWRPSDQKVYTSDIRSMKEEFDWEPKISTGLGIGWLIEWVEDNQKVF